LNTLSYGNDALHRLSLKLFGRLLQCCIVFLIKKLFLHLVWLVYIQT